MGFDIGVGVGGYIGLNLALKSPKLVDGLIILNTTSSSSGWVEWAYHKVNLHSLKKSTTIPESVLDYLIWHHLGNNAKDNVGLTALYRNHFLNELIPSNLYLLIQSFANRKELNISKDSLKMPILNIVGEHSPNVDATLNINMKVDPAKSTWMKINDTGMVLEEQPGKVAEAISLFLQGLGYTLNLSRSRSATVRPQNLPIRGD